MVDRGAVAFGEAGGREHQARFLQRRGALMVNHNHVGGVSQRRIHQHLRRVTVEIVLQHHHRIRFAAAQLFQRAVERVAAHQAQTHAVRRASQQRNADLRAARFQRFGDVRRRFDHRRAARMGAGNNQRFSRAGQRLYHDVQLAVQAAVEVAYRRRALIQRAGDSEAETRLIFHRRAIAPRGDIVEAGFVDVGYEQRMLRVLTDIHNRGDLPVGDFLRRGHFARFAFHRLTHRERHARADLGEIFAQYQHRIVAFHFAQRRRIDAAFAQHFQHQLQPCLFARRHAGREVFRAYQLAQREVALNAGARRADADRALRLTQNVGRRVDRLLRIQLDPVVAAQQRRVTRTILAVDVAVAETAAVAKEVVVNRAVVAVFDTTQLAVALARAGVAADAALLTDARRELHIPFTVIAFGVGFVGEDAGRADFHQVAGEFAFQRALFRTAEVDVVVRAVDAQIFAVGVIFVVAHAAVAGDTAVHLVRDKRAEILILVGAFSKAVAAEAMAGHHRHILQVTVAALFAHRTVVRVVGHQPLHHAFAKLFRFAVVNGDKGAVGGRRHAGHDETAAGILGVLELLHRALAASPNASQRRMPAKIRNIKAQRETRLQQVVRSVHIIFFTVYMDCSHSEHASVRLVRDER